MIDIEIIRKKPDLVRATIAERNMNSLIVDEFLSLDEKWRSITKQLDDERANLNRLSKERNIDEAKRVKATVKELEISITEVERDRNALIFKFPNIQFPDVPSGKDASKNKVLRSVGVKPKGEFKEYLEIAEKLDLIDIERASKVSGSRFGYIKGKLALLEFALIQFAFETVIKDGFMPVIPPVMLKPEILRGMGKIKFIEDKDAFFLPDDNLYLAGSAEHTIGPMHADEIFNEKDLPRRYVAFSTCFRREAGSYGKDTKGILRVHQFDKVELFSFTKPSDSEDEHLLLLAIQEKLLQALKLPYQVVTICTGDIGFGDARQFDLETWLPGQGAYRETHSASNTTDYQARGLNIKYRSTSNLQQPTFQFVHMLNATGFAIGRMLIAIIENYQTQDGAIKIPEALVKYVGFKEIRPDAQKNLDRG